MKKIKTIEADSFATKMLLVQVNNTFSRITKKLKLTGKGFFKLISVNLSGECIKVEFENEVQTLNFSAFSETDVNDLKKYVSLAGGNEINFYFAENSNLINKIEICNENQK